MNWLQRLMTGRYGMDGLSIGIMAAGMVFTLTNSFLRWLPLLLLSYLCFGLVIFRMFSKNTAARQKENATAARIFRPAGEWLRLRFQMWQDRKSYRYFSCPSCRQYVRVPKNKGKIRIVCPKCRKDFIKKT